jgi:hypothetical protein
VRHLAQVPLLVGEREIDHSLDLLAAGGPDGRRGTVD